MLLDETNKFLEARVNEALTDQNRDVYESTRDASNRLARVPYCVYLYYIRFNADGLPEVRHYFKDYGAPVSYADVDTKIAELAKNARDDGAVPTPEGYDFQRVKWKRVSYLAVLVDSPHWKLWKKSDGKAGIKFVTTTTPPSTPNHSFFDAKDVPVYIDGQLRDAIVLVNHVLDKDGNVLGHGQPYNTVSEPFHFDIYFDVGNHAAGGASSVFIIDPGGNNMGPPPPPP